ncbi:endolytic transglycosylase MltG [Thioalkalivibrio sp. XN279]|uniref:endolytic transglycosylase MltG n=1 Tax=Thioalkalivibrio sp. XN279 TaxID=2714953 RepID=UPI001F107C81|nr:endolytic transglycosylase MltG [Thioalkalivibrio sp. XN279]
MKVLLALLVLGTLAAGAAGWWAWRSLDQPGPAAAAVVVEIPAGASLSRIARRLEDAGVIEHALLFEWYGRASGQAGKVRAGEYRFPAHGTAREAMARLVSGEVVLHALTIVEGWNFRQLRAALAGHEAIALQLAEVPDAELMARLGKPGMHPEGWFLPETYRFPRGTTELELLRMAHAAMERALAETWAARADDLPLESPYEALVLASIIEKETGLADERREIAGVFARRLERGMRLQTDPTVIYGLGPEFDGDLRRADLRADTPYNTYTRHGLPPTPIAMPGRGALAAAVNPADGKALYFVATGRPDGSHYFSTTLEEHNRAVARYLATLRERRNSK